MIASSFHRFSTLMIAFVMAGFFNPSAMAAKPDDESKKEDNSSSTSLKLQRQSSQSSSSQSSLGNPLGNVLNPNTSLFNAGEWQIIGYSIAGYGSDTHNVTTERTVKRTTIESVTHVETRTTYQSTYVPAMILPGPSNVAVIIPARYDVTPVQSKVRVTTKRPVTKNIKVKSTKNVAGIQGGFGGAGTEARYFFTRWLGVGIEGDWLDGQGSIGTTLTTITARLVRDSNAYYAFGGTGVQFDEYRTQAIGKMGVGMEHRFMAGTSVFADAAWMFGSQQNAAVFRGGFKFSF